MILKRINESAQTISPAKGSSHQALPITRHTRPQRLIKTGGYYFPTVGGTVETNVHDAGAVSAVGVIFNGA